MEKASFEDFKKLEIRIGKILLAEKIDNSEKLLKLQVDFGNILQNGESAEVKKQIIAGIGKFYKPEDLISKECPFVFNLETKMINGLESQGMILAADDGHPVLMHPDKYTKPGSLVK